MAWFGQGTKGTILPGECVLAVCATGDEAHRVCSVLDENGIPYRRVRLGLEVIEFGNVLSRAIQVVVKEADLARAKKLIGALPPPRPGAAR